MIALISVLLSGVVSLLVALVTIRGSIKRDHEADWRKIKLELYREFVIATAGLVPTRANEANQNRYLDAANVLMLVGSKEVVKNLKNFQDNHLSNEYLKPLFIALRSDVMPQKAHEDDLDFKFVEFGRHGNNQIFAQQHVSDQQMSARQRSAPVMGSGASRPQP